MAVVRIITLSVLVLATALSPQFGRWSSSLGAGLVALAANENNNENNNANNNGNSDGNCNSNTNSNSNSNENCNSNENNNSNQNSNHNHNDNHNNGAAVSGSGPVQSAPAAAAAPSGPGGQSSACLPGGQENVLVSEDGRVAVRVFPSMQRDIRIIIR